MDSRYASHREKPDQKKYRQTRWREIWQDEMPRSTHSVERRGRRRGTTEATKDPNGFNKPIKTCRRKWLQPHTIFAPENDQSNCSTGQKCYNIINSSRMVTSSFRHPRTCLHGGTITVAYIITSAARNTIYRVTVVRRRSRNSILFVWIRSLSRYGNRKRCIWHVISFRT